MNILSFQQMEKTEIQLLKIKAEQKFMLKLPTSEQLTNIHLFQSKLFPLAGTQISSAIHKKVSFTDSLRTSGLQNQNTLFRMLTFHLLNTLFTQKQHQDSDKINQNKIFLLKTIKSTLYSKDADLTYIRNCPFEVNNIQMKVLGANFFQYMQELSSNFNVYCLRCAEWLLENNPLLVELFTLLLRVILFYCKIPKAGNYKFVVDPHKSIVGLLDFFDLQYQYSDNIFLQFQDGLLIAIIEGGILTGEYYQNEGDKLNNKRRYEIKTQVRMNLIQSLVVTVNDEQPQSSGQIKISKDDAKLFEFLLHSEYNNRQSESIYVTDDDVGNNDDANENEQRVKTPQFRQKKQFTINQKYRSKFSELILNESINNQFTQPDSSVKKGQMFNQPSFKPKNVFYDQQLNAQQQSNIFNHSVSTNNLIKNHSDISINLQPKSGIAHSRNKFFKAQFPSTVYTPQNIKSFDRKHAFVRIPSQQKDYEGEEKAHTDNCKSNKQLKKKPDFSQIVNCKCHTKKIIRNNFDNKVIDVFFNPANKQPHTKMQMHKMPGSKNLGIKSISDNSKLSSYGQSQPSMQKDSNHYQINIQQEKKPTFLKNFKHPKRQQNETKLLLNGTKSSQILRFVDDNQQDKHKRLSQMVPHLRLIQQQGNSKSTTRDESIYQHLKLAKKLTKDSNKQYSVIPCCGRLSLDDPFSPWRTNDNIQQRASHYTNTNNFKNHSAMGQLPTPTSSKFPSPNNLNVPKQINSANNQHSKDYHQHFENPNPERKKVQLSQQIPPLLFKNQRSPITMHKSQKVLDCYDKRYQK